MQTDPEIVPLTSDGQAVDGVPERPVELGHHHPADLAGLQVTQQLRAGRSFGQLDRAGDRRVNEDVEQRQPAGGAVAADGRALCIERQAALGLLLRRDTGVAEEGKAH